MRGGGAGVGGGEAAAAAAVAAAAAAAVAAAAAAAAAAAGRAATRARKSSFVSIPSCGRATSADTPTRRARWIKAPRECGAQVLWRRSARVAYNQATCPRFGNVAGWPPPRESSAGSAPPPRAPAPWRERGCVAPPRQPPHTTACAPDHPSRPPAASACSVTGQRALRHRALRRLRRPLLRPCLPRAERLRGRRRQAEGVDGAHPRARRQRHPAHDRRGAPFQCRHHPATSWHLTMTATLPPP